MGTLANEGLKVFHHSIGRGLVSIVLLSLVSAAAYGMAAVLQHHAAIGQPPELSVRAGLLIGLARRPLWLLGNVLDGVGYMFQFLALRRGSLPLVEPLLVLSLVFALPVAAWLDHRRIHAPDIASTALVVAGLGLFLGLARPGLGHPHASAASWTVLTVIVVVGCVTAVLFARRGSRRRAAVLLGAGSGMAFGYVAALTERTGHLLNGGVLHALAMWEPYALLIGGAGALLLTQSAFHAGALRLSLPTLTVMQPLVAVVIGLGLFGEHVDSTGLDPFFEIIGLAMVTFGVFALTGATVTDTEPRHP